MKRGPIKHQLDGLVALLLFGVFAACALVVLLTGADAYRRLTQRDGAAYDRRTCAQYVATRVRQADTTGGVAVTDLGGVPALILLEPEDEGYATWVYCYDGWLMELYAAVSDGFAPEDGERIMEIGGLELWMEGSLLTVTLEDTLGEQTALTLSLRSDLGTALRRDKAAEASPAQSGQLQISGSTQADGAEGSPSGEEGAAL